MTFFQRIAILTYVTLILFVGCFVMLFVLHWLNIDFVVDALNSIYFNDHLRFGVGVFAGALLVFNLVFYQFFSINVHRDKIIAFDNPSGRVTVSLIAVEDLIKRTVLRLSEVKAVRSEIKATKQGLDIKIRLNLSSEVNIPEVSARVQRIVTKKIQDTVGVEEQMKVSIYVGRIITEEIKSKGPSDKEKIDEKPLYFPFQGYRV